MNFCIHAGCTPLCASYQTLPQNKLNSNPSLYLTLTMQYTCPNLAQTGCLTAWLISRLVHRLSGLTCLQEFASASAALDAYIADYERWHLSPGALSRSTGPRLDLLPNGTPSPQPGRPRPPGTLRNRDGETGVMLGVM